MKYRAIIMVPKVMDFESDPGRKNVSNHAQVLCNKFSSIVMDDQLFIPRLLVVRRKVESESKPPLVFDPPPMAA